MTYRANERLPQPKPLWRRILSVFGWVSFVVAVAGWIFVFNYVGLI